MISFVKEYTTDLYHLFYPRICGGCDLILAKGETHLCLHCRLELPFTNYETFKDNPIEKKFFGRVPLEFATSLLFFSQGDSVQKILHQIKYNEQKELAIYMGRIFGERLQNNPYLKDINTILPVPLHPKKQHIRGYNQSELIATGMNEVLNLELVLNNVVRKTNTETQTRKNTMERWENVEHVFDIKNISNLKQKHILLVDDVLTTGATIEACAQVLLDKTKSSVSVATLATTV